MAHAETTKFNMLILEMKTHNWPLLQVKPSIIMSHVKLWQGNVGYQFLESGRSYCCRFVLRCVMWLLRKGELGALFSISRVGWIQPRSSANSCIGFLFPLSPLECWDGTRCNQRKPETIHNAWGIWKPKHINAWLRWSANCWLYLGLKNLGNCWLEVVMTVSQLRVM